MNADMIRLTIVKALFSNPYLEEILTLKGGNALKLQGITNRQSQDLDFSLKNTIRLSLEQDRPLFQESLSEAFAEEGYGVISFEFQDKPLKRKPTTPPYWGGYKIAFSLIQKERYAALTEAQRKNVNAYAESIEEGKKRIQIDLSFDEYTDPRERKQIDGVDIYLYSPLMIIYEKIRASCQQLPEYPLSANKKRARDLYDIYRILTDIRYIDLYDEVLNANNFYIIRKMFALKNVPLTLILQIPEIEEELREDYLQKVIPQIPGNESSPDFTFLFEYNMELFQQLYERLLETEDN